MYRNLIITMVSVFLLSCGGAGANKKQIDEFYTDNGGLDAGRIPLIKPWEAVAAEGDWLVHSITDTLLFSIPGVVGINVLDKKIILIHAKNTLIDHHDAQEGWFVLIPGNNLVKAFYRKDEYEAWLFDHHIKNSYKLIDPTKVYGNVRVSGTIDWRKIQQLR